MKKLNSITKAVIIVWLTAASSALMAAEPAPKTNTVAAQKAIRDYFRFPAFISPLPVEENQKVEVFFTTDGDGKVNFVMARTNNPALRTLVEERMNGITLLQLAPRVVHSVVLSFRKA